MATRILDLVDHVAAEPVARPVLRLVESTPAPKPMPPAWMVAPAFRSELMPSVREQQADYQAVPTGPERRPYRSIREVPRAGW